MCEVFVRLTSKTNPDPVKDRTGAWKAGMAVCVQDDGWKWSATELNWPYKILKLKGVPKEKIQQWLEPEYEDPDAKPDELQIYRRRRFIFDTAQFTKTLDTTLESALSPEATKIAALTAITEDKTATEPHAIVSK